jgi:hypothetical protein
MMYANSCEEHKYLAGIRKEKESFERLIKERGVCHPGFFDIHLLTISRVWLYLSVIFKRVDGRS